MSLSDQKQKVHFVGIGGIGMSGIAELLLRLGHQVSGTDVNTSPTTDRLVSMGAKIQRGHSAQILEEDRPDVIVYSSAISAQNPELVFARRHRIPAIPRAEMLGELMRLKRSVAVAGSHGKTTTTGMLSLIAREGGLDPTIVIGGKFGAIGSNASWGQGQWMIAEADESDGSFLNLSPEFAIVTNVDREHMDHYQNYDEAKLAFLRFINRLPFYGRSVLCGDNDDLYAMRDEIQKPRFWYGMRADRNPSYLCEVLSVDGSETRFRVSKRGEGGAYTPFLESALGVPGVHNVLNATAAIAMADLLGVPPNLIAKSIATFEGVKRRFEYKTIYRGSQIIEDYAHHPTEIRATLEAAVSRFKTKPVVVFQPHRYTRTRDQWQDFATCFAQAERVITVPIYPASESADEWTKAFDRENFACNIAGGKGIFCENLDAAGPRLEELLAEVGAGRPVLVLGAGNIYAGLSKFFGES
ncbi:MAG TPA: UDP-N-acetylmuramate--L-alanine ligase [Bdellovibrionota bacterium]|jgi:UDP-N-acetylmuramate--alanine ligase|nr:UDP-N-acetylmuramate--L-alanine ligase [Bdellovibrionota bacterium]